MLVDQGKGKTNFHGDIEDLEVLLSSLANTLAEELRICRTEVFKSKYDLIIDEDLVPIH